MKRFSAFPDGQARQIAAEFNQVTRRVLTLLIALAISIALGLAAGLYVYHRDQTAATHASCDATARLAAVLQIALPRQHVPGRTAAQQRNIDKFYRALNEKHVLNPPGC